MAVHAEDSLAASPAIDFVARNEFDFTIQEVAEGRPLSSVLGLSFRDGDRVRHTPDRPVLEDMDALPYVIDVYQRDLTVEHYFIGYLLHPVRVALHGPRLPLEVHVLPVAADRRRPALSHALGRSRDRGDRARDPATSRR